MAKSQTDVNNNDFVKITISVNDKVFYITEKLCNTEEELKELKRRIKKFTLKEISRFYWN